MTKTIVPTNVPPADLDELERAARDMAPELRGGVLQLAQDLRDGREVTVLPENAFLTPSQAAKSLGVSRTHLYKVLDSGALPYSVVGERDRRIRLTDFLSYQKDVQSARKRDAENTATMDSLEDEVLDSM